MIVGSTFVWLHFPKTGGHTVAAALRQAARVRPDLGLQTDRVNDPGWHETVRERAQRDLRFLAGDRTVVSGFRRLPWWLLSRVHYEAARPPHRCATRQMLCRGEFYEQRGEINRADTYAERYGEDSVQRWVRLEHLADDFVTQFETLLGPAARTAAHKLRKTVNATRLNYVKALDFYFTPAELAGLYAANPVWAEREARLYGDILRL